MRIKSLYTSLLRYFVRVTPNIGEDQTWKPIGHAVQDAAEFFKPEQDSTLHIYSYNLPENEWGKPEWEEWLREQHREKGLKTKVLVGPDIEATEVVDPLIRDSVIEVRQLSEGPTTHFNFSTKPRQLLLEMYHGPDRKTPIDLYFTSKPYDSVWDAVQEDFSSQWDKVTLYRPEN